MENIESQLVEEVTQKLSHEELHLVALQFVLYEGDWNELLKDMETRKVSKPYYEKLNKRIEEDIGRIHRLRMIEGNRKFYVEQVERQEKTDPHVPPFRVYLRNP